ncbi:helix-turn-helix transcriptional regulator [Winogradskya consettensis]|uniref:Transcriptional regulator n=1 Tax=Winogradskya consettensis TaxID=113560 RepID=A0A919VKD0_9ACTN|nr:helix-turn-helix transcriptional regulator [Actinoplanes consettensis]GIM66116.1 transcriptional regulator [Actinoplanes consettensis]
MGVDPAESHQLPLGAALARHRRRRGVTGTQLGEAVGMSQAKISRLENGVGPAEPGDVEAIARALGVDDAELRRLVEQAADEPQERMTDWRQVPQGLTGRQRKMNQIEFSATTIKAFQPSLVLGLLQTSEYARAVLGTFGDPVFRGLYYTVAAGIPEAVSMRMRRQEILSDPARRFRFLMAEASLANMVCPPEVMPAQITRIREVAHQDNVMLGIIPFHQRWRIVPSHGFELFDAHTVEIDLVNTGMTTQGKTDTQLYGRVFDALEEQATTDIDPILDRYMDLYLDLSRPARRSAPPEQAGRGEADPSA